MKEKPQIEVQAYAGRRGNERPLVVIFGGRHLSVIDVIDSWISTGINPDDVVEYGYVVRCLGGYRFRLIYSEKAGWKGDEIPGPHACDDFDL